MLPLREETARTAQNIMRVFRGLAFSRYKQSGLDIDDCSQYFNAASRALFKAMIINPSKSFIAKLFTL